MPYKMFKKWKERLSLVLAEEIRELCWVDGIPYRLGNAGRNARSIESATSPLLWHALA